MSFELYINDKVRLARANTKADRIEARFAQLHGMDRRTDMEEKEYSVLHKAMRARYKAEQALSKARDLVGQTEERNRRADSHAKILIGIAAIQLAKQDPRLAASLSQLATGMQSANAELIQQLLGIRSAASRAAGTETRSV